MIGTWTRRETGNTLQVRIIEEITSNSGAPHYRVCKLGGSPNYSFSVRREDVAVLDGVIPRAEHLEAMRAI